MSATAEPAAADWVVGIAASAGGVEALQQLLSGLPSGFPAAVVVAQHRSPLRPTALATVLGRRSALQVHEAVEGEVLQAGTVYLAPPDRDLTLDAEGRVHLSATSDDLRPSADHLFAALAANPCRHAVAVVLTGTGHDCVEGARAIRAAGGVVMVQDEASSLFFGMPGAVISAGLADRVLPLKVMADELVRTLGAVA